MKMYPLVSLVVGAACAGALAVAMAVTPDPSNEGNTVDAQWTSLNPMQIVWLSADGCSTGMVGNGIPVESGYTEFGTAENCPS